MKNKLLLLVFLLAACSKPVEIHTNISNEQTIELQPTECALDSDCVLHDANYGWGCCWAGRCDTIDYSLDNWISLNRNWLAGEKLKWCLDDCGPAPMCASRAVNLGYEAKCINAACMKTKIE